MRFSRILQLFVLSIGLQFLAASAAGDNLIVEPTRASVASHSEILAAIAPANVVYLAESHNLVENHQAQLDIISALYQKDPPMAIAMEMFQRPFQSAIDRYLAGEIGESELQTQTEYQRRWGFPWDYYAPILRFARKHQIPVIAANAPTEIIRQVAREGLASLDDANPYIPPKAEICTDNATYRQRLEKVYDAHAAHGNFLNEFDNFFATQVLWDETMAKAIADFYHQNPTFRIVVIAGKGHIAYGDGIPSRVSRRLGEQIEQKSIWLAILEYNSPPLESEIADYLWQPTEEVFDRSCSEKALANCKLL